MAQELAGKVAIVTGGAAGIGRASAELFVQEGAKVVVADIDEARGTELAGQLGAAARFMRTDVGKPAEVQALVDYAIAEFGGLDVMFNNAGLGDVDMRPLLERDFEHFDAILRVNLLGVMTGTQYAARHMAKVGGGSIINTSSIAGKVAGSAVAIYRAAKAGVINFSQSAALELGQHLIRVNCLVPGNIPTGMAAYKHPSPGMSQETADRIAKEIDDVRMLRQPLKRWGAPIDCANTALFLASDRSVYVTGQVIAVDGGAASGNVVNQMTEILEARARAIAATGG